MDIIKDAVRQIESGQLLKETTNDTASFLPSDSQRMIDDQAAESFPSSNPLSTDELSEIRVSYPAMRNEAVYSAFASLRTHIIQRLGKHACTIMVSAVKPQGGASFVALNLAAAFASDSSRSAVLVDCNFSGRRFEELGDTNSQRGITDYIVGTTISRPEHLMTDIGIPRLRLLSGGTLRNIRREYFTRPRAKQMFSELCDQSEDRAIIVDAPPASVSADANVIAAYCDAVLLVVPYGMATHHDVRMVARTFPEGKVLGSVFNNIPHWRIAG
jgi:Mrp family chromosome partitioning ATPase